MVYPHDMGRGGIYKTRWPSHTVDVRWELSRSADQFDDAMQPKT